MDVLEAMATFVRVVEAGSLAAAARDLHLSGAAVSRQLAALEARMGAPLILRTTRQLSVTPLGRRYYERCARILREVDDAQALGKGQSGVRGPLVVTAPVTLGLARVAPHMPALLARHRDLRIDLRLEDRIVDLVSDGVDVAIRGGVLPPDQTSLVAHPLLVYGRVLVAAPSYLRVAGEPATPGALASHELLLHLRGGGRERWRFTPRVGLRDGGSAVEVPIAGAYRSNAPYALRDAAIRGAGIALLPDWLVTAEIAEGKLTALLGGWTVPPISVAAIHRAELRGTAKVKAFVDHLRGAYE